MAIVPLQRPPTWNDAKRLLLAILQEAGGAFRSKTRLWKSFYRAHQEHWLHQNGLLSKHPIVAMPFGPGIDDGDSLIEELEGDGLIRVKRPAFKKDSWLFELLNPEVVKATPEERDSIRRALAWLAGRGAVEISNHTHRESRSWKRAHAKGEKGKELDIYLDLVPDEKYTCMGEQIQRQDAILSKVFGQHQR